MNRKHPSRIVWITGASSGIGKALAELFSLYGDTVIATSRSRKSLASLRGVSDVLACDVRKERDILRTARTILKQYRAIDIVVNNAGITSFKEFLRTSAEEFDDILDTNLRGIFLTTQAVLPSMLKRRRGMIVNILSYAAKTTYTKSAAYSAAKAGAEAMMNVLRAEVRGKGITVTNVYPGAVATSMWPAKFQKTHRASMMTGNEVAHLVYLLTRQPGSVHVEELVVRPQKGDLHI